MFIPQCCAATLRMPESHPTQAEHKKEEEWRPVLVASLEEVA